MTRVVTRTGVGVGRSAPIERRRRGAALGGGAGGAYDHLAGDLVANAANVIALE